MATEKDVLDEIEQSRQIMNDGFNQINKHFDRLETKLNRIVEKIERIKG